MAAVWEDTIAPVGMLAATDQEDHDRKPGAQTDTGDQEQNQANNAIDHLNSGRARAGIEPVDVDQGLNELAQRYLDSIVASRDLTPSAATSDDQRALAEDVARAIGPDGFSYRHTGLSVSYGLGTERAVLDGLEDPASHPAMLDGVMDLAGAASQTVPPGAPWLVPPVGGIGPAVDLTGYTVVVIVTAGDF